MPPVLHLSRNSAPWPRETSPNGSGLSDSDNGISHNANGPAPRTAEEIKRSESMLAEAQELAGIGSWDLDVSSGQATWSDNMYRLFDADPSDPAVRSIEYFAEHLVHPNDRERVLNALGKAFEDSADYEIEYRIRHKDGSVREVMARGTVVERDSDDRPLRMLGTIQDCTELRRAERQAVLLNSSLAEANGELRRINKELQHACGEQRESESRYRRMVDSCPDGIAILVEGRVSFSNDSFLRIHGYSENSEVIGRRVIEFVPEWRREEVGAAVLRSHTPGYVSPLLEGQALRPDGTIAELELNYVCIIWHGQPAMQVFVRDVTERKKLEQQVRQMQKLDAIGTLAGGIAHDFNNILSGILGYSDLLRFDLEEGSESMSYLEEISRAGHRAKELVGQILTFSRQAQQNRRPLAVEDVVEEALKLLRASLPSTIEIQADLSTAGALVLGDATEMHQVVMNLCTNASQAMPNGGALQLCARRIDIDSDFASVHQGLNAGPHVLLTVKDSGVGMSQELLERIFEPFFTTRAAGTGLGLAVVYGIIQAMGGCLTVYSEPGRGTAINIYLPQLADQTAQQSSRAETQDFSGNGERVLVVDDEPSLMRLSERILSRLGYQVLPFSSSMEALAAFQAEPEAFDLILCDQTMPQLTGIELARKALALRPGLPVVLATGFAHSTLESEARTAGVKVIVAKPLVATALAEALKNALAHA